MSRHFVTIACSFSAVMLLHAPAAAATIPVGCNAAFTVCGIPENVMLQLPFVAIAGDVVLTDSAATVSDVFRILNNIVNTGAGTGLGTLAFLYSSDDTVLPLPSTYSANVVFLSENPSGITAFTGNGTTFLLGAPEPSTLLLLLPAVVFLAIKAGTRMWRSIFSWIRGAGLSRSAVFCGILLGASTIWAQVSNVDQPILNLASGPASVTATFDLPFGPGPAQGLQLFASSAGLAFYNAAYTSLGGVPLAFNIVGTDPALGSGTTVIPTVLVPLKFIFPNAGNPSLDGTNVIAAVANSPMFQVADYTAGPVDLGVTQFGDALQRAEFWNLPGFSPDYHVLLGTPSVAATVTITVPAGKGNASALANGGFMGVVDNTYFSQQLAALIPGYSANQLPIFITDNVYLGLNGLVQNCCVLGYHASEGPPVATAKTWIYAAYGEPGTFGGSDAGLSFVDVVGLSHEIAEWLNDPFVGGPLLGGINLVPPAVLPGQGGACIINFETGDPLENAPFTFAKVTNGTTYHLQDEVVLPWFLHTAPSFSVNGWYTFQNTTAAVPLVVNSPPAIAGSYSNTAILPFAPVNAAVTGNIVYVGRGCPAGSISPGSPPDPYLADPAGQIALIDRGACAVSLKIDAAARAGATAVLIGLVAPGNAISFVYGGGTAFVPSLVITQDISNAIKGTLPSSPVNATMSPANAVPPPFSTLCGPG